MARETKIRTRTQEGAGVAGTAALGHAGDVGGPHQVARDPDEAVAVEVERGIVF